MTNERAAITLTSSVVPTTGQHYVEGGHGPAVVFLHGLGACKELWFPTIRALALDHRQVAFEWPGHGKSPASGHFELDRLAETTLLSCTALGISTFVLVGHSLGGNIAARIALAAPERVDRLVLVDAALDASDFAFWQSRNPPRYSDVTHHALRALTRPLAWIGRHVPPDYSGGRLRPLARRLHAWQPVSAASMRGYLAALWNDPLSERLNALRQPTLIIQGTHDPLVLPRQAYRAIERLPNARLRMIAGAFHTPMDECPDVFVATLRAFLSETREHIPEASQRQQ